MQSLNYAIVGAGIGGIAAARQLCAMNPSARIAIFESAREVGGRLRSKTLAGNGSPPPSRPVAKTSENFQKPIGISAAETPNESVLVKRAD